MSPKNDRTGSLVEATQIPPLSSESATHTNDRPDGHCGSVAGQTALPLGTSPALNDPGRRARHDSNNPSGPVEASQTKSVELVSCTAGRGEQERSPGTQLFSQGGPIGTTWGRAPLELFSCLDALCLPSQGRVGRREGEGGEGRAPACLGTSCLLNGASSAGDAVCPPRREMLTGCTKLQSVCRAASLGGYTSVVLFGRTAPAQVLVTAARPPRSGPLRSDVERPEGSLRITCKMRTDSRNRDN